MQYMFQSAAKGTPVKAAAAAAAVEDSEERVASTSTAPSMWSAAPATLTKKTKKRQYGKCGTFTTRIDLHLQRVHKMQRNTEEYDSTLRQSVLAVLMSDSTLRQSVLAVLMPDSPPGVDLLPLSSAT